MERIKFNAAVVDTLDEAVVVERIMKGEAVLFEWIIRKYNTRLYRTGWSYLKTEMDVEDAMQNCYLKAFEKLSTFKAQAALSTWLVRIMINECLMLLRKQKRTENEDHIPEMAAAPIQLSNLVNEEMKEFFEQAIKELPGQYRSIYIFREIEQYSTRETSQLLEISEQNVKVRLHRSKEMLRDILSAHLGKEELLEYHRPKCDLLTDAVMHKVLQREHFSGNR